MYTLLYPYFKIQYQHFSYNLATLFGIYYAISLKNLIKLTLSIVFPCHCVELQDHKQRTFILDTPGAF